MKFILGTKAGMTQKFTAAGRVVPCTVVQAGPCVVTSVKAAGGKDGYAAVQIGFGAAKRLSKPLAGHLRGLNQNFRWLKEFRVAADPSAGSGQALVVRGATITVATFMPGDTVKVTGTSKGRGFAGVVKRHGFHGQKSSHGHKDQERMPGSIGSTGPQRVFKGVRMAGRMGGERVTIKNLSVVAIDPEANQLFLRGAVPGPIGKLLLIAGAGELITEAAAAAEAQPEGEAEPAQESPITETPASEAETTLTPES